MSQDCLNLLYEQNSYQETLKNKLESYGILTLSEIRYIINKISNAMRRKLYITHFRLSINNNNDKEYNEIKNSGCCSFCDKSFTLKRGIEIKFGFNYNH